MSTAARVPTYDLDALATDIGDIALDTRVAERKRRSRDFYWYSPVLKRALANSLADAVITPNDELEVVRVLGACYERRIPVTARAGGTGNYGQSMPLAGGIILDLSRLTSVHWIKTGAICCGAGLRLQHLERQTRRKTGQELRFFPSTRKLATIGGFVAGGSAAVGSINWGGLVDAGNVLGLRLLTMEATPRALGLRGDDIVQAFHAYGTNGIIVEVEMPLAPAYDWLERVVTFTDLRQALEFAHTLAVSPGILKKLVTVIAAPIGQMYFKPLAPMLRAGSHAVLTMVAAHADEAFAHLVSSFGGDIVFRRESVATHVPPLYEFAWNHTTLQALKTDASITYLQSSFPGPDSLNKVLKMVEMFGAEVPMHVEFSRHSGVVTPVGLQLVRFTDDERLREIETIHAANGVPVYSPHAFTIEAGSAGEVDPRVLQLKRDADPLGLLNPGKMRGWDGPRLEYPEFQRDCWQAG